MTSARDHRTVTRRATLGGTLAAAGIVLAGRNVAEADEGRVRRLRPFRRRVNGVVVSGRHRAAAPGRPTLVFLHGWLENQHQFDRQLPYVRPGDGILMYDLRDQGDSSATGAPYLFGALVEDLAALLAAFTVERPVLIGQSLGGQIVMRYAIDCPGSLAGLVIANAAPPSEQDRTADGLAERLRDPGSGRRVCRSSAACTSAPTSWPATRRRSPRRTAGTSPTTRTPPPPCWWPTPTGPIRRSPPATARKPATHCP